MEFAFSGNISGGLSFGFFGAIKGLEVGAMALVAIVFGGLIVVIGILADGVIKR